MNVDAGQARFTAAARRQRVRRCADQSQVAAEPDDRDA